MVKQPVILSVFGPWLEVATLQERLEAFDPVLNCSSPILTRATGSVDQGCVLIHWSLGVEADERQALLWLRRGLRQVIEMDRITCGLRRRVYRSRH